MRSSWLTVARKFDLRRSSSLSWSYASCSCRFLSSSCAVALLHARDVHRARERRLVAAEEDEVERGLQVLRDARDRLGLRRAASAEEATARGPASMAGSSVEQRCGRVRHRRRQERADDEAADAPPVVLERDDRGSAAPVKQGWTTSPPAPGSRRLHGARRSLPHAARPVVERCSRTRRSPAPRRRRRAARRRSSRRAPGSRRERRSSGRARRARRGRRGPRGGALPSSATVVLGAEGGARRVMAHLSRRGSVDRARRPHAPRRAQTSARVAQLRRHHRRGSRPRRCRASSPAGAPHRACPRELQEAEERLEDARACTRARLEDRLAPPLRQGLDLRVGPHVGQVALVELDDERQRLARSSAELLEVVAQVEERRGVGSVSAICESAMNATPSAP